MDLGWPKCYSKPCKGYWIPYNIMGSSKTEALSFQRSYCSETRRLSACGRCDCLCITWLVFSLSPTLSCSQPMSFSCLIFLILPSPTKEVSDQLKLNYWWRTLHLTLGKSLPFWTCEIALVEIPGGFTGFSCNNFSSESATYAAS